MNMFWLLLLIFCYVGTGAGVRVSTRTRPSVVNIGSIFTLNSSIGKVAKVAIEAAVDDVNSNPALLKGTKLKLAMQDTNSSGFLGIVEGTSILLKPSNHDCLFLDGSDHTIRYGHMVVLSQPHDP
jgi:ionotropic glutamate receptor